MAPQMKTCWVNEGEFLCVVAEGVECESCLEPVVYFVGCLSLVG